MKNFQKRTLLKMANVNMGLVNFPKVTLTWLIESSKTTREANIKFFYILTHKEYTRIFENWGEKNWDLAFENARALMADLRKRV